MGTRRDTGSSEDHAAICDAATRAMKPVKKKGKENESGHARTDSAVIRGLVLDAITTITEHDPETVARGLVRDAIDKSMAKEPDRFGKGEIAGVAAPEAANNAASTGSMLPMLTLGIPGSPTTASR